SRWAGCLIAGQPLWKLVGLQSFYCRSNRRCARASSPALTHANQRRRRASSVLYINAHPCRDARMIARFAPAEICADICTLPKNEQKALTRLVDAARIMD